VPDLVPSFAQKLSWAENHLERLEHAIAEFGGRHPYTARKLVEHDDEVRWVLEFTEPPDPAWALIVGDVLYNLRSALDHLAGALNPPRNRYTAMFPIVREKVWEFPLIDGQNDEPTRQRKRWDSATGEMRPEAVAIIKDLQPTNLDEYPGQFHLLDVLNRLSNKDRHRQLLVHLTGLRAPGIRFVLASGHEMFSPPLEIPGVDGRPGYSALQNQATIQIPDVAPDSVVDVKLRGTVTEGIKMEDDGRNVEIPEVLRNILDFLRSKAAVPLSPYLHGLT
jgi:hypothetical protein